MRLFLDCDGVLADFERKAREILGQPPKEFEDEYGSRAFWTILRDYRDEQDRGFFESLPLMSDTMTLFNAVKHVTPTILTGCPQGNWAPAQKLNWRDANFKGVPMITCMAKDKIKHMGERGGILVDDKTKHRDVWIRGGGEFVHHTSAAETIAELKERFPIIFMHTDRWTPPAEHAL